MPPEMLKFYHQGWQGLRAKVIRRNLGGRKNNVDGIKFTCGHKISSATQKNRL
jgi:hypothetical protein